MNRVNIDIDDSQNKFVLTGDVADLLSRRRARLYLRDYLCATFDNNKSIAIPYEQVDRERTLQKIQRLLSRFGFEGQNSSRIEDVLDEYFKEERRFEVFSKQAYSIRNDLLDELHKVEFQEFTECLVENLPTRRLYPLQLLSAYHLAFSQNACNFSVPGSGKTTVVYAAYAYLKSLPENHPKRVDKLLVIGPLSSFAPWEDEFKECFAIAPSSKRLSGGVSQDERIKHFYSQNPAEITLISYNGVVNSLQDLSSFLKRYKAMVVLDEAHKIKNVEGGVIASSVLSLAKFCGSRVVLTGTPAPNGYEDIYNLFAFIWPTKDIIDFNLFNLKEMSENPNDPRIQELIQDVSPYFIRIKKSDLEIPNPTNHEPTIVEMSPLQREIYTYIEQSYIDYLINENMHSSFRALLQRARLIRLMQASTNPYLLRKPLDDFFLEQGLTNDLFIDDSSIIDKIVSYKELETPQKFVATGNLVEKIIGKNQKVVVWAAFIQNLFDLQEYLESIGIDSRILYGATPIETDDTSDEIETRERIIAEFHKKDSPFKVLIANPMAISESISLHKACKNAIYLERTFNAAHFIQSKDRIHRYGLRPTDEIDYYYVLSNNVTDWTIHERLLFKEERMMQIIENEPIPLFNRIEQDEEADDIKALIENYVKKNTEIH